MSTALACLHTYLCVSERVRTVLPLKVSVTVFLEHDQFSAKMCTVLNRFPQSQVI